MDAAVDFKRSEIHKRTVDAANLGTKARRLAPGFAASAEKNLHFDHRFNDFGNVSGQICHVSNFEFNHF